jgi:hypothetical protein
MAVPVKHRQAKIGRIERNTNKRTPENGAAPFPEILTSQELQIGEHLVFATTVERMR